jgi:hypothetical protein
VLAAWHELRQRRFPPEFRIAPAVWPADLLADLQHLERAVGPIGKPVIDPPWDDKALASTLTSLWRARRKVESADGTGPMRQVGRHVQAAWDSLESLGVKVLDHDNEPFDSGLSLLVLAIQPHPGISRETIIETVKPTIYLNERAIQMGEVIVGAPEGNTDS